MNLLACTGLCTQKTCKYCEFERMYEWKFSYFLASNKETVDLRSKSLYRFTFLYFFFLLKFMCVIVSIWDIKLLANEKCFGCDVVVEWTWRACIHDTFSVVRSMIEGLSKWVEKIPGIRFTKTITLWKNSLIHVELLTICFQRKSKLANEATAIEYDRKYTCGKLDRLHIFQFRLINWFQNTIITLARNALHKHSNTHNTIIAHSLDWRWVHCTQSINTTTKINFSNDFGTTQRRQSQFINAFLCFVFSPHYHFLFGFHVFFCILLFLFFCFFHIFALFAIWLCMEQGTFYIFFSGLFASVFLPLFLRGAHIHLQHNFYIPI